MSEPKRRKVVNEDVPLERITGYECVFEEYEIEENPNNPTNGLALIKKIKRLICSRVNCYSHVTTLQRILKDIVMTCESCQIYTNMYSKFYYCESCCTLNCEQCSMILRSDEFSDQCVTCFEFFDELYQSKVRNGWRKRLTTLTSLNYLPVELWKIVFHFTYDTL